MTRGFYQRDTLTVARQLIGKLLVRTIDGVRISGIIYETEAYDGETDLACHASSGKTNRNVVMYGEGGHAYVYFTYGMHWMMNCVTGKLEHPSAVLIRAILPIEGINHIKNNRSPIKEKHWCDGPGKLTKAFGITNELNGVDLCNIKSPLHIEKRAPLIDGWVAITPRIGIDRTPEPWKSKPWRFIAEVSKLKFI
ncbi:MAG: DNA-3-methyladenine glycosylase [Pelolinea sp.]|nr:DNA-3-methyladenine glycosylase [Pelolinea sp.]